MRKLLLFAAAFLTAVLQAANMLTGDSGYELKCGYFCRAWGQSQSTFKMQRADDAPEGRGYVEIAMEANAPSGVNGVPLPLTKGKRYVFSCWIKADTPMIMDFVAAQNKWQDTQMLPFEVTTEWRRVEVPYVPAAGGEYWLILQPKKLAVNAVVSIDAVQFEAGKKATPFVSEPQRLFELSIPSDYNSIFFNDEPVALSLRAMDTRGEAPQELTCKFSITDWTGKIIRESAVPMSWQGTYADFDVDLTGLPNGLYTVRSSWLDDAGAELGAAINTFAVISHPRADDPEIMPYGGVNSAIPAGVERIGVRWVEVGTYWMHLEPSPGKYAFEDCLRRIKALHDRGFKVKLSMYHLPAAPKWAWRPDEKAEMESWGLSAKTSLLPTDESLKNLEVCIEKFLREAGDMVDLFEIGGEDELVCGNEPYYRRKYPEAVINGCVNGPVCDGLAKVTKAYIAGARRANPDMLIAAGRPSGGDCYGNNFEFSRNVLSKVKTGFDYFGMDCYTVQLRYLDEAKLALNGNPDRDMPGVFERANNLCAEMDNQIPFVSEYGFAIDNTVAPDSPLHQEQTWRMLQASLQARLQGSPWFFWFNTKNCIENGHYEYGLWHDTKVMLLVPALSQLNQVLEGVHRYESLLTPESGLRLALFGQRDRAILALWNGNGDSSVELDIPKAARMVDFLGNPAAKAADGRYIAKRLPVYFIMDGQEAYDALKQSMDTVVDSAFPFTCLLEMNNRNDCALAVDSIFPDAAAVLEFTLADGKSVRLENAGAYPWRVQVHPETLPENLEVKLTDGTGRSKSYTFQSGCRELPEGTALLDEFGATRGGIYPPDPHLSWFGGYDLGGKMTLTATAETLTFEAVITDDTHINDKPIEMLWNGDCLQMCISPKVVHNAEALPRDLSAEDTEFLMSIQNGKPVIFFSSNPLQLTPGEDYQVTRDDAAGTTTYRVTLSRKALHLEEPGCFCGISYVVFDDDEGAGQSYYYQLSPGIAGGKDMGLFPVFILP